MDLTRPVVYRDLQLNNATSESDAAIIGCMVEAVDYSEVAGVGYTEKRSAADGFDASDVFLGARRVQLQGSLYGYNRADLFDRLQDLRYAFSPTAAYAESPGEYGFLPLEFEVPTLDSRWPVTPPSLADRFIQQAIRCRPVRGLDYSFRRDTMGGQDAYGGSIMWAASLMAKDPRVYAQVQKDHVFGTATNGSGSFINRGDYPAPLNILLYAPAGTATSTFNLTIGETIMHITVPTNATKAQTVRYDGTKKVLTLEIDTGVSLRMDLLKFDAGKTHPLVPATPAPGTAPFTWSRTAGAVAMNALSHMWFWEAWA